MTLKAPLAGQPISSSQWLQPVAAAVNRLEHAKAGAKPAPAQQPAAGNVVESAIIVGEGANTITVQRDSDLELVVVAKPPHLRGNVATRINGDGDTEEIFPAYFPGVVILIVAVIQTGVAGVAWADVNWEGRRWTIEV